ncbi:DUF87 domain-containing protein [Mycobacterium intracellulare]|uniref:ATP-binding protein n=1 Tax=Mycobacterium intracellulare TaxID=1767 RepID=UPI001CDAEF75|nr:DUF87 domain-containing protein [Mycobacterium intracellulare]MCA2340618.1 DUF87 domain-containing protein [Mycobacterium intracellulare]
MATLISERYFTKPGDAFVNGLTALLTVLPLRATAPHLAWQILTGFLIVIFAASLTALLLQGGHGDRVTHPALIRLQAIGFHISSVLGRARVVYSVVFLTAVVFFVRQPGPLATSLLVFWGVYLALWPLGIPQLVSRLFSRETTDNASLGRVIRVDSPNLARVLLAPESKWTGTENPIVIAMPDGSHRWGIPLMCENRTDGVLATILMGAPAPGAQGAVGEVRNADDAAGQLSRANFIENVSDRRGKTILGLVRESSRSSQLRFELLPSASLELGQLIVVQTAFGWVYYQVIDGETAEEPFGTLHYGSQIAIAIPTGILDDFGVFGRPGWIPKINAPVFGVDAGLTAKMEHTDHFLLGYVPGTHLELRGDFVAGLDSHTAILGATGSGKTELAFDLIRHAAGAGIKVICIDLTSQYAPRLAELEPIQLTISDHQAKELGEKLFAVETGSYGATAERKVLHGFAGGLREEVDERLKTFLADVNTSTALIELREIANTKATLWITEMYLSTLLKLAKDGVAPNKVLVVIEEAHTVMPESSFAGLGDYDSKGTIAKISQLALQGRKYGVGLLILTQRTATVSKSVLTQCNTVISFSCIDDTSINFLRNVYGSAVAEGLPALRRLRAVAHGQWVNSEVPVVFDVPFDPAKAERRGWAAQRQ